MQHAHPNILRLCLKPCLTYTRVVFNVDNCLVAPTNEIQTVCNFWEFVDTHTLACMGASARVGVVVPAHAVMACLGHT